ncbi:MAG: response regulator [Phenylobacterium sp.]|uniref:response regulator n=1 Tax=Phenylobacterium sp. TaxID=1871053 RepID=UPI00391DBFEA
MSGPRVMLVEDESLVALVMEDMLADLGCEVVATFGALSPALDWFAAGQAPFDGALLDVNLGGELVFPLAEALEARGVPFVFATAYGALPEARFPEAMVVRKPVDPGALGRAVAAFARS